MEIKGDILKTKEQQQQHQQPKKQDILPIPPYAFPHGLSHSPTSTSIAPGHCSSIALYCHEGAVGSAKHRHVGEIAAPATGRCGIFKWSMVYFQRIWKNITKSNINFKARKLQSRTNRKPKLPDCSTDPSLPPWALLPQVTTSPPDFSAAKAAAVQCTEATSTSSSQTELQSPPQSLGNRKTKNIKSMKSGICAASAWELLKIFHQEKQNIVPTPGGSIVKNQRNAPLLSHSKIPHPRSSSPAHCSRAQPAPARPPLQSSQPATSFAALPVWVHPKPPAGHPLARSK